MTRIAVLQGGDSAEAEVSRSSAAGVVTALKEHFDDVMALELDGSLSQRLAEMNPDVIFPILHGPPGEDGTLQGFLEILGYPYVGSGVHASALAMDKIVAKDVFRSNGLPVIEQLVIQRGIDLSEATEQISSHLGDYVVVKPACQGSAVGVTLVDNANQLPAALDDAFQHDHQLLIERRLDGREITVGVLDTDEGCLAFPVIEIVTPGDSWYDFEHRYTTGLSEHLMPADISPQVTLEAQHIAVVAHQALGCRDLSRADLLATDSGLWLLEVNTLPGMTPTSLYPDGASGFGLDFPALCKHLVERASARSA